MPHRDRRQSVGRRVPRRAAALAVLLALVACGRVGYGPSVHELVADGGTDAASPQDVAAPEQGEVGGDAPGDWGGGGDSAGDGPGASGMDAAADGTDGPPPNACAPPPQQPALASAAGCPPGFALVPGSARTGVGPVAADFCVSRFEMKAVRDADGAVVAAGAGAGSPVQLAVDAHHPEARPDGRPWRYISRLQAVAECQSLGPGYHLVTNDEWMTVALLLERQTWVWSDCAPMRGALPIGLAGLAPEGAPVTDQNDPWSDTGVTPGTPFGQGGERRRALSLPNGEVLWDLTWLAEWVDVRVGDRPVGLSVRAGTGVDGSEALFYEFDSMDFVATLARSVVDTADPPTFVPLTPQMILPAAAVWDGQIWRGASTTQNYGRLTVKHEWRNNKALMRGGRGLFDFNTYEYEYRDTWSGVGFRCSYRP